MFFFSSRRRHTSIERDWSSDVCSSDLVELVANRIKVDIFRFSPKVNESPKQVKSLSSPPRSEERRVG